MPSPARPGHRHRPPSAVRGNSFRVQGLFLPPVPCVYYVTRVVPSVHVEATDAPLLRICRGTVNSVIYATPSRRPLARSAVCLYRYVYTYITRSTRMYTPYARARSRSRQFAVMTKGIKYESWKRQLRLLVAKRQLRDPSLIRPSLLDVLFLSLSPAPRCKTVSSRLFGPLDERHSHVWVGPSQQECRRRGFITLGREGRS